MNKITYPCETAAIFDDVIYPIQLNGRDQIEQEIESAVRWFSRRNNEERAVVKASMLVSFRGAYLTHKQSLEIAA